jgi:hypothetical protein
VTAYCNTCEVWRPASHTCYPVWEVRDTDCPGIQPEDIWDAAALVRAPDAETAAEKFAEADDFHGDWSLARNPGRSLIVEVRQPDDPSHLWHFRCWAETNPTYLSEEIEAPIPSPSTQEAEAPTTQQGGE